MMAAMPRIPTSCGLRTRSSSHHAVGGLAMSASTAVHARPATSCRAHQPAQWTAGSQASVACRHQQHHLSSHRQRRGVRTAAGAMDVMPAWTLDQIAGLVFGVVMMASVLSARSVDEWIARQQRRQLGLCEECGGLYDAATCSQNKCPMKTGANKRT